MGEGADPGFAQTPTTGRWWQRFPQVVGRFWQPLVERSRAMQPLFLIFGVLLLVLAVIVGLEQGRDVVLSAVRIGHDDTDWTRLLALTVAQLIYGGTAWFCSRLVVENGTVDGYVYGDRLIDRFWCWLPRVAALLALLPMPLVILSRGDAGLSGVILLAVSAALLLFLIKRQALHVGETLFLPQRSRPILLGLAGSGFVLAAALNWLSPVVLARAITAPGLALIAAGAFIAGVTAVYTITSYRRDGTLGTSAPEIGNRRYLPVLVAMIVLTTLSGRFGWSGHYRVAGGPTGEPASKSIMLPVAGARVDGATLRGRLDQWLASLPPGPEERPLVIVATSGGASRAAYWTGMVLTELDDIPGFRDHLFAISSVSGGSLGTAAYLATLSESPGARGSAVLRRPIQATAGGDHLAPVIGALLFGDSLARLTPLPAYGRDTALEHAFAASWDGRCPTDACATGGFEHPFLAHWRGPAWLPLWFANGTRVEDGRRIITAPVAITDAEFPDALDFHRLVGFDVPWRTVVTNTARFPLISPTGELIDATGKDKGGIIDGGYFENGGIETAADIMNALNSIARERGIRLKFILVAIDNDGALPQGREPGSARLTCAGEAKLYDEPASLPLAQLLDPLLGLYNTRSARGTGTRVRTARELPAFKNGELVELPLCPVDGVTVGLNWALSRQAKASLDGAFRPEARTDCRQLWAQAKARIAACLAGQPDCAQAPAGVTTPAIPAGPPAPRPAAPPAA